MTVTKHWVGASLWRLSPHYSLFTFLILGPEHTRMNMFFPSPAHGLLSARIDQVFLIILYESRFAKSSISMIRKDKCWVFVLLNFLNGTKTKAKSYCFAWNSTISVYISYDLIYVKVREIFLQPALNLYGSSCTFTSRTLRHISQVQFQNEILISWWYKLHRNVNWTVIVIVYVVWLFRGYCFKANNEMN